MVGRDRSAPRYQPAMVERETCQISRGGPGAAIKTRGPGRGWKPSTSATIHDGKEESDFCTLYLPRCVLPPHVARRDVALRSRRERRRGAPHPLSTATLRKPRSLPPHPLFSFVSPAARTCGASTTELPLLIAPHGGVVPPPPVT